MGAGLGDFWDLMLSKPHSAGGFLWVLTDEAVKRTDQNNRLDGKGNQAPDGILGPYKIWIHSPTVARPSRRARGGPAPSRASGR